MATQTKNTLNVNHEKIGHTLGFLVWSWGESNPRPPACKVEPNINTASTYIKHTSKHKGF